MNTSEMNVEGIVQGQTYKFGIAGANMSSESTKRIAFFMKEPFIGDQYAVSGSETISVMICAESMSLSADGGNTPITDANITSVYIREFGFGGPPTITNLAYYDPITGASTTSLPLWSGTGCTAFRINKTSGTWPSHGEIRVNITGVVNNQIVTENMHVANINKMGG
jgi:hypothetical protein